MMKSKFTEEQIAFALRQADTGHKVPEVWSHTVDRLKAHFTEWQD